MQSFQNIGIIATPVSILDEESLKQVRAVLNQIPMDT
jgi:uncharacterized protein YlxP (DUF503 family)